MEPLQSVVSRDLVRSREYELLLPQLRRAAAALLGRERQHFSLQPTLLVSEAWLRVCSGIRIFQSRQHLIAASVQAMKHFLIDRARHRRLHLSVTLDSFVAVSLPDHVQATLGAESRIDVREAFMALFHQDPHAADTLWLRIVEEKTLSEVAREQHRPIWRVREDEAFGLHWLRQKLTTTIGHSRAQF